MGVQMRIKHRSLLRAKEQRALSRNLEATPYFLHQSLREKPGKIQVERIVLEDKTELFLIEGHPWLISTREVTFPALSALLEKTVTLPEVVVDMGAVPHIANGADVMAPGIVEIISELAPDDFVVIIDEKNLTPIAIGRMLMSGSEIQKLRKGRAIKTLHYVGDHLWNLLKQVSV